MKKTIPIILILASGLSLGAGTAFAHAIVSPSQAGVASYTTFSLGVPSEKPQATVAVRLLIPSGVLDVTPNVKQGWKVSVKKDSNANVTEIDWTGGSIPAGERDDFVFRAQVPATPMTLEWKAYQTYADGTIVSWDQEPVANSADDDSGTTGPYSQTEVVDDLTPKPAPSGDTFALDVALAALALAVVGLVRRPHA